MKRGLGRRWRWYWFVAAGAVAIVVAAFVILPRAPSVPARAVFIGDSYTHGVGASAPEQRWTTLVAHAEGWEEINRGLGGTGYLATAGPSGCGRPICENYLAVAERLPADHPDIVVVAGGQNDFVSYHRDPAQVTEAVKLTFQTVRRLEPGAQIIAVGPSTAGSIDGTVTGMDEAVRSASDAVDARYVSLLEPRPVIESIMVLPDHAHVGDQGHQAIAQRVIDSLR